MSDEVDKALESVHGDCFGRSFASEFEYFVTSNSRKRRYTVRTLEALFLQLSQRFAISDLLEIGANDGRHSQRFLSSGFSAIHCFEPNAFLGSKWIELAQKNAIRYNTFALSNENGSIAEFHIPLDDLGQPHSGVSSLNTNIHFMKEARIQVAIMRADSYLEGMGLSHRSVAAWIDVEGSADLVLEGFGDRLGQVKVALIEVESFRHFSRDPSLPAVLKHLKENGLTVLARDWMNKGQFNILVISKEFNDNEIDEMISEFRKNILNYAAAFDEESST